MSRPLDSDRSRGMPVRILSGAPSSIARHGAMLPLPIRHETLRPHPSYDCFGVESGHSTFPSSRRRPGSHPTGISSVDTCLLTAQKLS